MCLLLEEDDDDAAASYLDGPSQVLSSLHVKVSKAVTTANTNTANANVNPFRLGGFRLSESLGGGHPAPPMIFAQKMIFGKNF